MSVTDSGSIRGMSGALRPSHRGRPRGCRAPVRVDRTGVAGADARGRRAARSGGGSSSGLLRAGRAWTRVVPEQRIVEAAARRCRDTAESTGWGALRVGGRPSGSTGRRPMASRTAGRSLADRGRRRTDAGRESSDLAGAARTRASSPTMDGAVRSRRLMPVACASRCGTPPIASRPAVRCSTWRRTPTWSRSTEVRHLRGQPFRLDRDPAVPRGAGSGATRTAGRLARWMPARAGSWTRGSPPALSNRPVFDDQGRHVGTPDLLDAEAGSVVEYDGAAAPPGSRSADATGSERSSSAASAWSTSR